MKKRGIGFAAALLGLCCLAAGALTGVFVNRQYEKEQYRLASALAEELSGQDILEEQELLELIKNSIDRAQRENMDDTGLLASYGYEPGMFQGAFQRRTSAFSLVCAGLFFLLASVFICLERKYRGRRIAELSRCLAKADRGVESSLLSAREDEFSCLQDEIQKTIQKLSLTREAAVRDKERLAENLADISHQIKTFITSVSLQLKLSGEEAGNDSHTAGVEKQLKRLEHLVESLLTLSRLDANVVKLKKCPVDVYTLLELSAEAAEGILREREIRVEIPNHPEVSFEGDLDWSVEAFLNLIKNSAEHTPRGGRIVFDYSSNPLYTEITAEDNGEGFSEKELPHIFERFYQGGDGQKKSMGAGLGLSLARAVIERQGGCICAANCPIGGARFTVRFASR